MTEKNVIHKSGLLKVSKLMMYTVIFFLSFSQRTNHLMGIFRPVRRVDKYQDIHNRITNSTIRTIAQNTLITGCKYLYYQPIIIIPLLSLTVAILLHERFHVFTQNSQHYPELKHLSSPIGRTIGARKNLSRKRSFEA